MLAEFSRLPVRAGWLAFFSWLVVRVHVPPSWLARDIRVIPWRQLLQVRLVEAACGECHGRLIIDGADRASAGATEGAT